MKFIDKMERKYGRFGIRNLTVYIVICYVIGYMLLMTNSNLLSWFSLEPKYIMQGQIWRLVTWVIYPPSNSNVLFFALMILFFTTPLEHLLKELSGHSDIMYLFFQE